VIRTLIVDDSAVSRMHLAALLQASPDFDVVGVASSEEEAVQFATRTKPDLVVLDVFIPSSPAARVTKSLLAIVPACIVLVSDAPRNCDDVFDALLAGAIDFVPKPSVRDPSAAKAMLRRFLDLSRLKTRTSSANLPMVQPSVAFVAVASSTGGPVALAEILKALPASFPVPIAVAQHVSEGFAEGLAKWLSLQSKLKVHVARHGDGLFPGHVYLGPSHHDLVVRPGHVEISKPFTDGYHPSGDTLFESAVEVYGRSTVALILSGIGEDGSRGAALVRQAGGLVMAQDRGSCAVFGMPAAVAKAGNVSLMGTPAMLARGLVDAVAPSRGRSSR
jgi:two-component system chemotaxis response regulator CheB